MPIIGTFCAFFRVIHSLDCSGKFQKKSRSCIFWFVSVWSVVGGASLCNCADALRSAHSLSTDTKQRAERIRTSALALADHSDHPLLTQAGWQTGAWITPAPAGLYCKGAVFSVSPLYLIVEMHYGAVSFVCHVIQLSRNF